LKDAIKDRAGVKAEDKDKKEVILVKCNPKEHLWLRMAEDCTSNLALLPQISPGNHIS